MKSTIEKDNKPLVGGFKVKVEGLVARGRPYERGSRKNERGISKFRGKYKSCKYCKNEGMFLKNAINY